jgi:hypothetical protein
LVAEREAGRTHTVAIRCGGWAAPFERPKKTKLLFWLFLVIFG